MAGAFMNDSDKVDKGLARRKVMPANKTVYYGVSPSTNSFIPLITISEAVSMANSNRGMKTPKQREFENWLRRFKYYAEMMEKDKFQRPPKGFFEEAAKWHVNYQALKDLAFLD